MEMIVRTSELSSYRQCRQQWAWAYLDNLESQAPKSALQFGTLIHEALEIFYPPGKKRGGHPARIWRKVWKKFIDEGGQPFLVGKVEAEEMGLAMLRGYWELYGKDDQYEVIAPEQTFQIDIFDDDGEYLCTYTGTVDAVIRDLHTGKIGMFEHKTGATLEPFGAPLIMDEQAGAYWTFGAMYLASIGVIDSPEDLDFVLYNRLRKAMPSTKPRDDEGRILNKDGSVSKNQPAPYFKREYTWRTNDDRLSVYERVQSIAKEIKLVKDGKLNIYKNPGKHCGFCQYRDMCEVHETRSDWESVRDGTMKKWDPYGDHRDNLGADSE